MKLSFLILFFYLATNLHAQLSVILPEMQPIPGNTINVPVKLAGASSSGTPIGGANIQFTYDPAVVSYVNLVNFNPAMPQSQWFFSGSNGTVAANWIEPSLLTVALADSSILFEVQFIYNSGQCPLSFTVYEFTDASYNLIPTTPVNGMIQAPPQEYQVTFQVDMSRQTVSPDGVHISGSFNGWNPGSTALTAGSNGVYSVTLPLMEEETFTYRFVNGNSMSGLEIVPSDCGVAGGSGFYNRSITIPSQDTILEAVCFSMCTQCPVDIPVTFVVDMSEEVISPAGVHLAGSFNNWSTGSTPMVAGANQVYTTTLMLTPGQFHVYRFVNGNTTAGYESVPAGCGSPSSGGGYDRYVSVPQADTLLPEVCFSSCTDCGGTGNFVNVTFRVDMQNESVSSDGVHIAGSFQGWQPGLTPMVQVVDHQYAYTQSFLAGSIISYKYVNGNSISGYESVPSACSTDGNRILVIPENDTSLSLVCFASCDSCLPQISRQVTFLVDMSLSEVSAEGVHLAGSFQGWNPSSLAMNLLSGSIYSITIPLVIGETYEYRFINGSEWMHAETVPEACALNGNRYLQVSSDTLLEIPCFSKCGGCWDGNQVEMQSISVSIQCYPNPYSAAATLGYTLPVDGQVTLMLTDNLGRAVYQWKEGYKTSGTHQLELAGRILQPGIYLLRLQLQHSDGLIRASTLIIRN